MIEEVPKEKTQEDFLKEVPTIRVPTKLLFTIGQLLAGDNLVDTPPRFKLIVIEQLQSCVNVAESKWRKKC